MNPIRTWRWSTGKTFNYFVREKKTQLTNLHIRGLFKVKRPYWLTSSQAQQHADLKLILMVVWYMDQMSLTWKKAGERWGKAKDGMEAWPESLLHGFVLLLQLAVFLRQTGTLPTLGPLQIIVVVVLSPFISRSANIEKILLKIFTH